MEDGLPPVGPEGVQPLRLSFLGPRQLYLPDPRSTGPTALAACPLRSTDTGRRQSLIVRGAEWSVHMLQIVCCDPKQPMIGCLVTKKESGPQGKTGVWTMNRVTADHWAAAVWPLIFRVCGGVLGLQVSSCAYSVSGQSLWKLVLRCPSETSNGFRDLFAGDSWSWRWVVLGIEMCSQLNSEGIDQVIHF